MKAIITAVSVLTVVIAGGYWALSAPPAACSSILADQQACASLAARHNLALAVAIAAGAILLLCLIPGKRS